MHVNLYRFTRMDVIKLSNIIIYLVCILNDIFSLIDKISIVSHQAEIYILFRLQLYSVRTPLLHIKANKLWILMSNSMCYIAYHFEVFVIIIRVQNTQNIMDIFMNKYNFVDKRSYGFRIIKYRIFV